MSEKSQKAVEMVTEILKAHPGAGNIAISDALIRAGYAPYPSLIAKVRKELGIPSVRGRKPGKKTESKAEAQPAKATSRRQQKKADVAAPVRAPDADWMKHLCVVAKASQEVGGLQNLVSLSSCLATITKEMKQ